MNMKEKIEEIQNSKLKKLNQIIIDSKEALVQCTHEYFEIICDKIIETEEKQVFDFLGKGFHYKHHDCSKTLTREEIKTVQENIINSVIQEMKIADIGEQERILLSNIYEDTVLVYLHTKKGDEYWIAIYPEILESLLNEAGLEYDKTSSSSKIATPDNCPIVLSKDKEENKQYKQRKKKRY